LIKISSKGTISIKIRNIVADEKTKKKVNQEVKKEEQALRVDVEKVIADKNPKLLKTLPGFIIRYLKHIVHQEDLNGFLDRAKGKKGLEFSEFILSDFEINYQTKGFNHIPPKGRYLFASNHPLGGMDGIALLTAVGTKYKDIKFPVNDILMNVKGLNTIFLPINKHGSHSKSAALKLEEAYSSDAQIIVFPAGLVSRKQHGKIIDLEWKKNFVKKAIQHQRDIIPVHITGRNTNFFYNLANIRKQLGIKINIEMLYLADEMYKQRGKNLTLHFGTPIPWQKLTTNGTHSQWAQKIKETVYQLAKND
jgi:putative hemolysin